MRKNLIKIFDDLKEEGKLCELYVRNDKELRSLDVNNYNDAVEVAEVISFIENSLNYYSYCLSVKSTLGFNDAKQELTIKILRVLRSYQKHRGQIKTFFVTALVSETKRLIRKDNRGNQKGHKMNVSLNDIIIGRDGMRIKERIEFIPDTRLEYDLREKFEMNDMLDSVERKLTGEAKKIFNFMRENINISTNKGERLTKKMIADKFGKSKQSVCNIIRRRIKPVMKKMFTNCDISL